MPKMENKNINQKEKIKDFIRKLVAKSINAYRKSSIKPFRSILYKLYLKYIEPRMIVNRIVVTERDGIKYKLDLRNPQDSEIYYAGYCEPTVVRIIKQYVKSGMIVFDVGAHTGAHTLRLAKLVGKGGKVIAVDPDLQALSILRYNLGLNNIDNVIIENIAFSDNNQEGKEMTLDEYVKINKINRINFMKIDTEGYEYKIIKGGIDSIEKFSPIMVIEFSKTNIETQGDTLEDLVDLLSSLGYSFFSTKNLKEYPSKKVLLDSMLPKTVTNVLCKMIPK